MHHGLSRSAAGFVLAFLAVAASGCSGRRFDVAGQVKYNGSPLGQPGGQVVFVGPNGSQVAASVEPDGLYRASGVPAGLNRVAVYWPNPEARTAGKPRKGEPLKPAPAPFLTPARYASAETSELSVQVGEGTVFDIDLSGPPLP